MPLVRPAFAALAFALTFVFFAVPPSTGEARATEPRIEARVHKDEESGRIEARAEMHLELPPARIWPALADAIHGKLSKRTRLCLEIPAEKAANFLENWKLSRLPIPSHQEEAARASLQSAGSAAFSPFSRSPVSTRYSYRVISVPMPLVADRWFLAQETFDASRSKAGTYVLRIEGRAGNIHHYDGSWTLEPLPAGGTRLNVRILSDLGVPTPAFLAGFGAGELRESLKRLHALATSSGRTAAGD